MEAEPEPGAAPSPQLLAVTPAALGRMLEHAEAQYPDEACGALLGRAPSDGRPEILDVMAAANARQDERGRRYLIGPDDVRESERHADAAGLQVVGYYHSHPDHPAVPSEFDREHAWPWYIYMIVSVKKGRVAGFRAWRLSDDREEFLPVPFEGEGRSGGSGGSGRSEPPMGPD